MVLEMNGARCVLTGIGLALLVTSCTHKIDKFYPEIVTRSQVVTVPLVPKGAQKVSVTYLGCGNLVLEHNGEAIMTDPFFSNQKLLALAGKIRTKEHLYREWKGNLDAATSRSAVQAMLVSHTHYDHVMDLPTMLHDHYFQNLKVVYGNRYMPLMLTHFRNEGVKFDSLVRSVVYDPRKPDAEWKWIQVTPKMRFLAILSNHAPHTKSTLFMSKPLKPGYFDKKLVWHNDKVGAFKWTVGDTYSFLVDFIEKDTLRLFIQTSASNYPNGLPPEAELKKKGVDIAFMCYASAMNVPDYPNKMIEQMKPEKLVFVHWEDFFKQPPTDGKFRLVRGTKPHRVRDRIDKLGKKTDYFIMPKPGTRLDIMY
jgi:hypothetical protein